MKAEQIVDILVNELSSVYCNNCAWGDSQEHCEDCHRKSMMWGISEDTAKRLADNILEIT